MLKKIALIAAVIPGTAFAQSQPITINIGTAPVAQQVTLAGTWSFVAKCPLVTTTGTATFMTPTPGSYSGTFVDSLGQVGQIQGQIHGQNFTHSAKTQWAAVVENGVLSADGQSYTLTNTVGCLVTATRT